jgi:hypothetical protein
MRQDLMGSCLINTKQVYIRRILELMRSAILVQLFCIGLQLSAQQASFGGIAINSITREPLSGAHITVSLIAKFPDPNQPYGATSAPDGRFSFPSLPAGRYQLLPRRNGFIFLEAEKQGVPSVAFTLQAGDTVKDRIVELTPEAIISGRVTDEFGDPVEGAFVGATPVTGDASRSVALSRMNGSADDRGRFRITGAPGKFRISVRDTPRLGVHEIRTDGSEIPVYAETWYPSTDSRERGAVVEAIGGRETEGIDIRLIRKRSLTLSGVLTGVPEGSVRAQVFVHTRTFGLPFYDDG